MHRSRAERTGENAAPLAKPRRWGGSPGTGDAMPPPQSSIPSAALAAAAAVSAAAMGMKREREDELQKTGADGEPRKRRSRWGDANKADLSHLPTAIPANVSKADLDKYAIQVRLEEISRKLATGDVVPADRDRSPSPPPIYDNKGHRTNTREVRYRKKLDDERVALVERQMALDPNYRAPAEYHAAKRNTRPSEKVYLPIKEFPEINFFGLLVGPRGNTLKGMERESGAKISIRGKGSVKDGKGRPGDEDEEEMHCVVNADDEAKVKKCVRLINLVIETAASTPESENDHKRNQLRELAALNGTLRDDENQICQNCGGKGHRRYECPEERNWTAHITCHKCGQQGHLARDCTSGGGFNRPGPPGGPGGPGGGPRTEFDSEYANLMAELGGGAAAGGQGGQPRHDGGLANGAAAPATPVGPDGKKIPPWRNPEIWNGPGPGRPMHGGHFGGRPGFAPPGGMMHQGYNGMPADQGQGWSQGQGGQAQAGGQTDYTQAWQEYYAAQAAAAAAAAATGGDASATAAAGNQGQQDYSREWAEYYKQTGIAPPTS